MEAANVQFKKSSEHHYKLCEEKKELGFTISANAMMKEVRVKEKQISELNTLIECAEKKKKNDLVKSL